MGAYLSGEDGQKLKEHVCSQMAIRGKICVYILIGTHNVIVQSSTETLDNGTVDSPFIDPDGAKDCTETGRPMFKKLCLA
jgi:hypothetical protein